MLGRRLPEDAVVVFDTTCKGNRAEIALDEFQPHFGGVILRADVALKDLAAKHAKAGKKAHWFWGEMLQLRRHLLEVALGPSWQTFWPWRSHCFPCRSMTA